MIDVQHSRAWKCWCLSPLFLFVVDKEFIGFVPWNRFCDRLDSCLEPLRSLLEKDSNGHGRFQEQAAKTKVLQDLQQACDKLSSRNRSLQFTLYCPFHSELVNNWHIQVTYTLDSGLEAQTQRDEAEIPSHVSDTTSTGETNDSTLAQSSDESQALERFQIDRTDGLQESHPLADALATRDDSVVENQDTESGQLSSSAAAATSSNKAASFQRNSGLGVLGIDYIEHEVQPTDTLKGLCLAYNISAVRLRQANLLSGDNDSLLLAPKVLAIPISEGFYARVQETESQEYKLNVLLKKYPKLGKKAAKAYLELSDWVLEDALSTAREDIEWEKDTKDDFL